MSTRSITSIRSRWGQDKEWRTNAVVYRHWDGYLEGHGEWLYRFLGGLQVINGLPAKPPKRYANGPGRLAAQLVAQLQEDGHEPDLVPDAGPHGQEFHYQIDVEYGPNGGVVNVSVFTGPMTFFGGGGEECNKPIFSGSVKEYGEFLETAREETNRS